MGTNQDRKIKGKRFLAGTLKTAIVERHTRPVVPQSLLTYVPSFHYLDQEDLDMLRLNLGAGMILPPTGACIVTQTTSNDPTISYAGVVHSSDYMILGDSILQESFDYLWREKGANQIFRNVEDFVKWLRSPNIDLNGNIPLNYLFSDIDVIAQLLGRLIHGVMA